MIKYNFVFFLFTSSLLANILFMGSKQDTFKCDSEIGHPISLMDCKNIEAVTDISICYFLNASLGCKKLFKGDSYSADKIDTNSLSFKRLLSFNTNKKTSFGIKRFGNEAKDIGIPNGTIIKPKNNLHIKLDKEYNIELVLMNSYKKILLQKNHTSDVVDIPGNLLEYSKKYYWQVKLDTITYEGSFDTLDQDSYKEMNNEITNLVKSLNDEKSIRYIKSVIYDQYGLTYDRNIILKGAF
ncbi:hypothetical protein [Sulfurimonas sp.]|uniref:hypothetical protein n=1 Tax=Sulfurimonas sp. TaxID=2022749 RepID=UPI002638E218|nr:hypothetical protein [Sulfurimonas sp.]MCW8896060.1 hypothetical protein [Sulfurimonas sp.]